MNLKTATTTLSLAVALLAPMIVPGAAQAHHRSHHKARHHHKTRHHNRMKKM